MVPSASIALLVSTFSAIVAVRGDAIPTAPGPGTVFNQGSTCSTSWVGDADGKWGNMKIQLMSGSNFAMQEVQTLVTGLDGNKDGTYTFECPAVDPYSAIYFFQYTAEGASGVQWATRFTIADKDGKSVPPAESTQPDGAAIPWGIGHLAGNSPATTSSTSSSSTTSSTSTTPESSTSTSSITVTVTSTGETTASSTTSVTTLTSTSTISPSNPGTSSSKSSAVGGTTVVNSLNTGITSATTNSFVNGATTLVVNPSSSTGASGTQAANSNGTNNNGALSMMKAGGATQAILLIAFAFALLL